MTRESGVNASGSVILRPLVWVSALIVILACCFAAFIWRSKPQEPPGLRAELLSLMQTAGLPPPRAGTTTLSDFTKRISPAGMNRLLAMSAPTASLPALQWMVQNGAEPLNIPHDQGTPLIHLVAKTPTSERIAYFLKLGLNAVERDREGQTLLHAAAKGELDKQTLSLLVSAGLSVRDRSASGLQPLHRANAVAVPVLVTAGAEPEARDDKQRTPLHWAAMNAQGQLARALLNSGASVHSLDDHGRSALHLAALARTPAVYQLLVDAGASTTLRDSSGQTPAEIAAREMRNYRVRAYR